MEFPLELKGYLILPPALIILLCFIGLLCLIIRLLLQLFPEMNASNMTFVVGAVFTAAVTMGNRLLGADILSHLALSFLCAVAILATSYIWNH